MKLKLCYLAMLSSTLLLQACGGGGLAGGDDKDIDTMRPEAGVEDTSARPRPPLIASSVRAPASDARQSTA